MSITSELTRLQSNIESAVSAQDDILAAIAARGVTVPAGATLHDVPGLIGQINTSILPAGYTKVNFIENKSGSTYFNTGIGLNKTDTVVLHTVVYNESNHTYAPMFGGRVSQYTNNYTFGVKYDSSASSPGSWYLEKDGSVVTFSHTNNTDCLVTTYVSGNKSYVDVKNLTTGNVVTTTNANIGTEVTPVCFLFSMNNNGSKYTGSAYGRLYEFTVTTYDGTERCHLLPALRNSDGVSGFYDLTNDRFITNGAGATGYHTFG